MSKRDSLNGRNINKSSNLRTRESLTYAPVTTNERRRVNDERRTTNDERRTTKLRHEESLRQGDYAKRE
jgi:hypothetical protein